MPRERAPGAQGRPATDVYPSPSKKVQIPLNDDDEEKAQRMHSRKALHTKQMEQYKAAASPARKRKSLGADSPHTPGHNDGREYDVAGTAVTPMKRVPILANFEEWMKMATDNKINATNSWNFALIDYFHDLSLLKEGDGVNFQKASCTLDGCVKIYTSRVDSVATETGKLLSGLAASKDKSNKKGGSGDPEGEEVGDEDEENEDGSKKPKRKRAQRSAEATLAPSFDSLKLKKMELEFAVDPLFKKASADFDEGGAKGLLLNHLSIDGNGRIVFDSSDDAQATVDEARRDSMEPDDDEKRDEQQAGAIIVGQGSIDVAALGARFFPDLAGLDDQHICPSLRTFELGCGDKSPDLPFLKAPDNWRDEQSHDAPQSEAHLSSASVDAEGFDPINDNDGLGGFDMPVDTGFGEGGEAWARDAALQPQVRVFDASAEPDDCGEVGTFDADGQAFGVMLQHRAESEQDNILNYFDSALQKNWAGPEHWKVTKIKEAAKPAAEKRVRKEKEPFEIDFAAPMTQDLANALYTPANSNAAISLPRKEWRSRSKNLLPDDKHFNSQDLLKLFLKPKAKMASRLARSVAAGQPSRNGPVDSDSPSWAQVGAEGANGVDAEGLQGQYDADFFADDALPMPEGPDHNDDTDEFADARERFSPEADGPEGPGIDGVIAGDAATGSAFGANLVAQSRRVRPEYVRYARVAKKVDVRRLKEEMWRGIGFSGPSDASLQSPLRPESASEKPNEQKELKFTSIMNNLRYAYPQKQLDDISTSYGFICLLHLANEKGLIIENVEGWEDLKVRKDETAITSEGDL